MDTGDLKDYNQRFAAHMGGSQQIQNICITFVPRRPNVEDVVQTLYKYFVFTGVDSALNPQLLISSQVAEKERLDA